MANPCIPMSESDIDAKSITVTGKDGTPTTYYYNEDPESPLGYTFYEYSKELDGYIPVDQSDGIISVLLRALTINE
jgi:hypothetical protein